MDVRQNSETPCILEKSEDGTTWTPFADLLLCPPNIRNVGGIIQTSPDGETWTDVPPVIPPVPPRSGGNERCLAAANAAEAIKTMHFETVGLAAVKTELGASIALGGLLASLVFFPIAPAAILAVLAAGLFVLATEYDIDEWTPEVEDRMRCILYCASEDAAGVVTFDFERVVNDTELETSAEPFYSLIVHYLDILQSDGLNLAGSNVAITEADCSACECPLEWCYEWADESGLLAEGFVHNYHDGISDYWSGSSLWFLTHVEFGFTWNGLGGGSGGTGNGATIWKTGSFTGIVAQFTPLDGITSPFIWDDPVGDTFNGIGWGLNVEAGSSGNCTTTSLKLKGTGEMPPFTHGTVCEV